MNKKKYIIAIDGPAGAGKSTAAKLLAEKLGYLYLDSGAMYRSLTWKAMQKNIPMDAREKLISLAKNTTLEFKKGKSVVRLYMDDKPVGDEIRTPEVTRNIKFVADNPAIRSIMVELQRKAARDGGVVMEGRDIGTAVFPHADFKFYLEASVRERALRRFKEYRSKGVQVKFTDLLHDIRRRDEQDSTREAGPLVKASDSIVVRSTRKTPQQVLAILLKKIEGARKRKT